MAAVSHKQRVHEFRQVKVIDENQGTYGVVTSYTIKVYPEFPAVSYMDLTLAATGNITVEQFVSRIPGRSFWRAAACQD